MHLFGRKGFLSSEMSLLAGVVTPYDITSDPPLNGITIWIVCTSDVIHMSLSIIPSHMKLHLIGMCVEALSPFLACFVVC